MKSRDVERLGAQLDRIEEKLTTLEVAFMVSGPNNPVVAEAYNGLRQQVVMAASDRRAHLTQLAGFASAVEDGATTSELEGLIREWMRQHSLIAVTPESHPEAYDVKGEGPNVRVRRTAFVDAHTGALVSLGQAIATNGGDADAERSEADSTMSSRDAEPVDNSQHATDGDDRR